MDPHTILHISEQLISRKTIDDLTVVVNVQTGQDYVLNPIAGRIWELLDGQRTLEQIAQALSQEYNAPIDQVLQDTLTLACWLSERNLVVLPLLS